MSNVKAKKEQAKVADKVGKSTHFTKREIEVLQRMYNELLGQGQCKLDRQKFRDILHKSFGMTDDILMDRVFRVFDKDNDSFICQTEWIEGLSIILRGNIDEKIKYTFDVYDLNSDGYITREEIFHLLKASLIKQPTEEDPDEGVKDLVELTLKKMCPDHGNRLSYEQYYEAVSNENLLLEALGDCLPNDEHRNCFLAVVSEDADISTMKM